jgi:hypothetical protein
VARRLRIASASRLRLTSGTLGNGARRTNTVNTVLGNLKTMLSGAFHAFKYPKYASSYPAAFAYRFNRRFDLRELVARLIIDVSRCKPRAQRVVRGNADDRC